MIPAYDEAARIGPTLAAVRAWLGDRGELIVVDDGSRDATAAVAAAAGARVVALGDNRGKGAAVRAGLEAADGEVVAFMDADGSIPIAEVARLLQAVEGGVDVAVASRVAPGGARVGARPLLRELGSAVFRGLVAVLAPTGVADTQCGAKALSRAAARDLGPALTVDGFAFDVELLWLARRRGLSVVEVPIVVRHEGGSKVGMLRHAAPMLADVLRVRLRHRRSSTAAAASTASRAAR